MLLGCPSTGTSHLAASWPFRTNPLFIAWVVLIMPCALRKSDMSGLLRKQQCLALLIKSSALILCLTANCTSTWPPTEWQHVWRRIPLWAFTASTSIVGVKHSPEKYFLLTFITCHRAKSSRSEQESEWTRAPFATLQHYILMRQGDKASPPSCTIRLNVEVKTACSVLLFVENLSLEMLIFSSC